MTRFLLDQGHPRSTAKYLKEKGWDVEHAAGLKGRALAQLLERVWPAIREAVESGAMVTVTERNVRVRRLPVILRSK